MPRASAKAKAPFIVSPAPVVSATFARMAGMRRKRPSGPQQPIPFAPSVTISFPPKRSISVSTGVSGSPRTMRASCSLGVRKVTASRIARSAGAAGAGFQITVFPAAASSCAAERTVSMGISFCSSTTSAFRSSVRMPARYSGVTRALAPGITVMALSFSATTIMARPLETPGTVAMCAVCTPLARRFSMSRGPKPSSPTQPNIVTSAPRRAAATAWLAPLPPGRSLRSLALTVSPGRGMRAESAVMSMLMLPITAIFRMMLTSKSDLLRSPSSGASRHLPPLGEGDLRFTLHRMNQRLLNGKALPPRRPGRRR